MKEFLNDYMGKHKEISEQEKNKLKTVFIPSIDLISKIFGKKAFRFEKAINAAFFDAIMVGLSRRLLRGEIKNTSLFKSKYNELIKNADFQISCRTATSDEKNVNTRINLAIQYFEEIV